MKWQLTTGRARIIAPPKLVWQWVSQPGGWQSWNPKIEDVVPLSLDAPRLGWRFRIVYRVRKSAQLVEAELIEFVPGERLVCRTIGGDLKPGGEIIETYSLVADEETTLLTHAVDLTNSKMPWFSRLAVVTLTKLFNSSGELGHVMNLKALIEDRMPPP